MTLTSDEALVMFELIHRWEDSDRIDPVLMPGGQTALWGLSGRLESMLVEPLQANYRELVDNAWWRLAERGGTSVLDRHGKVACRGTRRTGRLHVQHSRRSRRLPVPVVMIRPFVSYRPLRRSVGLFRGERRRVLLGLGEPSSTNLAALRR